MFAAGVFGVKCFLQDSGVPEFPQLSTPELHEAMAVIGGLGSIPGALLGGLVFGVVNEFSGTYLLAQRDVVIFAILILVLVTKPTGLLGKEA